MNEMNELWDARNDPAAARAKTLAVIVAVLMSVIIAGFLVAMLVTR